MGLDGSDAARHAVEWPLDLAALGGAEPIVVSVKGDTPVARLRELALRAGALELADEAAALDERIREQRFYVACVGQFKRGKSTLLNAMVGEVVLPTGVVPVTSVPTILRYGPRGARVRLPDGWIVVPVESIGDFVTEQHNPGNSRGVLTVEVLLPSDTLEGGLCLIDTPGLGSVIDANTSASRELVSQVDAALVVLGADPPISGEELGLIELIATETGTLLFVLNKSDRTTAAELQEASDFTSAVLRDRLGLAVDRIDRVCAVAPDHGPDWPTLLERLRNLAGDSRDALVRGALRRGMGRVGAALRGWLREELAALTRPLEECERRVAALVRLAESSDRALLELAPLLTAEEQRLEREFRARADHFVHEASAVGVERLHGEWSADRLEKASREEALEAANTIAQGLIRPWLRLVEAEAEADYERVALRFREVAERHLARLHETTTLADVIPGIGMATDGFRIRRHFAFSHRTSYHYGRTPVPQWVERLLPRASRRHRRARAAERYLLDLLQVNASRVVGDLIERVRESRRGVESELAATLRRIGEVSAGALQRAREVRGGGAEGLELEIARVEALLDELEHMLQPWRDRAA